MKNYSHCRSCKKAFSPFYDKRKCPHCGQDLVVVNKQIPEVVTETPQVRYESSRYRVDPRGFE